MSTPPEYAQEAFENAYAQSIGSAAIALAELHTDELTRLSRVLRLLDDLIRLEVESRESHR